MTNHKENHLQAKGQRLKKDEHQSIYLSAVSQAQRYSNDLETDTFQMPNLNTVKMTKLTTNEKTMNALTKALSGIAEAKKIQNLAVLDEAKEILDKALDELLAKHPELLII